MGATLKKNVMNCVRKFSLESEADLRRRYELANDGIPQSLKERFEVGRIMQTDVHMTMHAVTENATGRNLAMKAFNKKMKSFRFLDIEAHALSIAEISSCTLRHEHICAHIAFFESQDLFCSITERTDGGNLAEHFQKKIQFDDATASKFFIQCLVAVGYLHSKKIIHRDLRPEQFVFASKRRVRLKLADLTHSSRPKSGHLLIDPAKPVVFLFAAPETLASSEFSTSSDVWSLGCCLYEMLYGHPPYTGEDRSLVRRIVDDEVNFKPLFSGVTGEAVSLLKIMLNKASHSRCSVDEATNHIWFLKAEKISIRQKKDELTRRTKLQELLGDVFGLDEGNATVEDDDDGAGAVVLQSQFSRSLTGTCSNLSISTPSDKHSESDNECISDGFGDDPESEQWQFDPKASYSESDEPPSGGESHSGTDQNSEDQDDGLSPVDSSNWSEIGNSDWSAQAWEVRAYDDEHAHWKRQMRKASTKAGTNEGKAKGLDVEKDIDMNEDEGANESSRSGSSSNKSGSKSSSNSDGESNTSLCRDESPGSRGLVAASTEFNSWGDSEASDALERMARHRDDASNVVSAAAQASQNFQSGRSSGSAPWEFQESNTDQSSRKNSVKSSSQSGSSQGGPSSSSRTSESSGRGQEVSRGRHAANLQDPSLATIQENAPAEFARKQDETLGEVTRRSVENASVSRHESQTISRAPSSGMIVLSRRSNSTSSSSSSSSTR